MSIERILQTGLALATAAALANAANALPMDPDNTHDNCQELAFEAQLLQEACDEANRETSEANMELIENYCQDGDYASDMECYAAWRSYLELCSMAESICAETLNAWADFQTCLDEQNPYWL